MFLNYSAVGVRGQLSHHIPQQLHHWFGSVDPGIAGRVSAPLQRLRLHDLQAAANQEEGLLYGT